MTTDAGVTPVPLAPPPTARTATPSDRTHGSPGTRARLLNCALSLFVVNSFAGTSLQMIADKLGVTKAAVYHHFKTREEILASVIEPAKLELRAAVAAAQARRSATARSEAMLASFIDVTVHHRALVAVICTDPGVTHHIGTREDVAALIKQVTALLTAHQSPPESEVNGNLVLAGIAAAAASPVLAHLSDEVLHEQLLDTGRRILGLRRRHY